jgi:hypothetical protein
VFATYCGPHSILQREAPTAFEVFLTIDVLSADAGIPQKAAKLRIAPMGIKFNGSFSLTVAYGQSDFVAPNEELVVKFVHEFQDPYVLRNILEGDVGHNAHVSGDGSVMSAIPNLDKAGCVELLCKLQLGVRACCKHGGMFDIMRKTVSNPEPGKGSDAHHEDMLHGMVVMLSVIPNSLISETIPT